MEMIRTSTPVQRIKFQRQKSNNENIVDNNNVNGNGNDDENSKPSSPIYLTIEEVFNRYPLKKELIRVSIFAIIQSYDNEKGILTVMDHTRKCFAIKFIRPIIHTRPKCVNQSPRLPLRTGDIVRITSLFLYEDFTRRCNNVENIVVFESFKNEIFNPFFVGNQQEFTDEDHDKVIELTNWNVSILLEAKIRSIKANHQYYVDCAFQVLCTLKYDNRIILACWNGCPFQDYQCMPLIKLQQIIDTLNEIKTKPNVYGEEFIKKIYNENKIIFISVYGIHRVVATVLKPLDFIVVYNLLIKSDNFSYAKHSYILYDGINFGRCIRLAEENSELAIALKAQIEKKCVLGETFDPEIYLNQSLSQIIEISNDDVQQDDDQDDGCLPSKRIRQNNQQQQQISFCFSNTLDDSSLLTNTIPCFHNQYTKYQKEIIYRHFYSSKNSNLSSFQRLNSFDQLINQRKNVENEFFLVDAKFHSVTFGQQDPIDIFQSMSTLRQYACIVFCNENDCNYQDTFESFFQKSSEWLMEKNEQLIYINRESSTDNNESQDNQMIRLKCPNCHTENIILSLDFILILQDYDNGLIVVRLTRIDANVFFNCSTYDLCQRSSPLLEQIPAFFKHAFHITNEQTDCLQKITWTLMVNDHDQNQREFHLVDVSIMNKNFSGGISNENI
ncbi:uncharacterized protein LOC113795059 [Dermatophagoides pteronyssinus]|uniref:uncharacterized protein LOC113795059 n=1 Tax=Dermatophagoides pteronyssinus TaxID=6956 RepID=UPI003F664E4A